MKDSTETKNENSYNKKVIINCLKLKSDDIIKRLNVKPKGADDRLLKVIDDILKNKKYDEDGFYKHEIPINDIFCPFLKNNDCVVHADVHKICPSNSNFQLNYLRESLVDFFSWGKGGLISVVAGLLGAMLLFFFARKKRRNPQGRSLRSLTDGDSMDNLTKGSGNIVQRSDGVQRETPLENTDTGNSFQYLDSALNQSTHSNSCSQGSFEMADGLRSSDPSIGRFSERPTSPPAEALDMIPPSVHNGEPVLQRQSDLAGNSESAVDFQNRSEGAVPTPTAPAAEASEPSPVSEAPDIAGLTQTLAATDSSTSLGTSAPAPGKSYPKIDHIKLKGVISRYLK